MKTPAAKAARRSSAGEQPDTLRPLASLISKSAKAQQKLAPGTWQYKMLDDNLRALRRALALLSGKPGAPGDLPEARRALAAMIARTAKALVKFPPGTSQHSLLRNRLRALRRAAARVRAAQKPAPRKRSRP